MGSATISEIRDLVNSLVTKMVSSPGMVTIDTATLDGVTTFTIFVSGRDAGKVIGRGGRVARSLRIVVGAVASESGLKVTLNIPNEAKETISSKEYC